MRRVRVLWHGSSDGVKTTSTSAVEQNRHRHVNDNSAGLLLFAKRREILCKFIHASAKPNFVSQYSFRFISFFFQPACVMHLACLLSRRLTSSYAQFFFLFCRRRVEKIYTMHGTRSFINSSAGLNINGKNSRVDASSCFFIYVPATIRVGMYHQTANDIRRAYPKTNYRG